MKSRLVEGLDHAVVALASGVQLGDVVLTLGAGDGYVIGERLLERMEKGL